MVTLNWVIASGVDVAESEVNDKKAYVLIRQLASNFSQFLSGTICGRDNDVSLEVFKVAEPHSEETKSAMRVSTSDVAVRQLIK
jgi:hypothetical protein